MAQQKNPYFFLFKQTKQKISFFDYNFVSLTYLNNKI